MATMQTKTPEEQLRVLPILVGALTMGVVVFAGVSVFLALTSSGGSGGAGSPGAPGQTTGIPDVMGIALASVTIAGIVGYFVVGAAARGRARRVWEERTDDERGHAALVQLLMVTTIIRAALAEGFGLFAGVLILLYGEVLPLAVMAVSVMMLVAMVPARSRFRTLEEAATGVRTGRYGHD